MKKFIKLNDNKCSTIRVDNIQSITSFTLGSMSHPLYSISIFYSIHGSKPMDYIYTNMKDMIEDKNNIENILLGGEF